MLKIGLTGNYLSGYTDIADLFEEKGIKVFDADVVLRFMTNYSIEHTKKISSILGPKAYIGGVVDSNFFDSKDKFDKLLDCLQVDLIKAYEKWRIKNYNSIYTIFKCSILFERSLDKHMNFNISVYRPKMERRRDMAYETALSNLKIEKILDNEMDELNKNLKSNFIIHNYNSGGSYSDNQENLKDQIHNIHRALIKKGSTNSDASIKNIML